jgi:hypothetical protein
MAWSGVITSHLKMNSNNVFSTTRKIANEIAAAREELLNGRTPIQALYDMLRCPKCGYIYDIKLGPGGNVESLFFSKENMIAMCHRFR